MKTFENWLKEKLTECDGGGGDAGGGDAGGDAGGTYSGDVAMYPRPVGMTSDKKKKKKKKDKELEENFDMSDPFFANTNKIQQPAKPDFFSQTNKAHQNQSSKYDDMLQHVQNKALMRRKRALGVPLSSPIKDDEGQEFGDDQNKAIFPTNHGPDKLKAMKDRVLGKTNKFSHPLRPAGLTNKTGGFIPLDPQKIKETKNFISRALSKPRKTAHGDTYVFSPEQQDTIFNNIFQRDGSIKTRVINPVTKSVLPVNALFAK